MKWNADICAKYAIARERFGWRLLRTGSQRGAAPSNLTFDFQETPRPAEHIHRREGFLGGTPGAGGGLTLTSLSGKEEARACVGETETFRSRVQTDDAQTCFGGGTVSLPHCAMPRDTREQLEA